MHENKPDDLLNEHTVFSLKSRVCTAPPHFLSYKLIIKLYLQEYNSIYNLNKPNKLKYITDEIFNCTPDFNKKK